MPSFVFVLSGDPSDGLLLLSLLEDVIKLLPPELGLSFLVGLRLALFQGLPVVHVALSPLLVELVVLY